VSFSDKVLLGSLNFTIRNVDQIAVATVPDGNVNEAKFTRILLDDATAELDAVINATTERGEFKNVDSDAPGVNPGGLGEILDISANAVGDVGLNAQVGYFFIAEDRSGGVDLYSVGANGENTDLLANDVLVFNSGEELTQGGRIHIEMLNETQKNVDGLIAYSVEDGGKTEAKFLRILTDDDTMEFASFAGVSTARGQFNDTGGLNEIVGLSANAVGSDGFSGDDAYMMLVTDDGGDYDLFSVTMSGSVDGVLAQDVLKSSYGSFDAAAPSTKLAMLNETVKGADGLIVQLGEDTRSGSTQEVFAFTRIFTDDDTGEFAFMGGNSTQKFATDLDGNRERIDVAEILAFEATPIGTDGVNRDLAYTLTALDEDGNVDIYGVNVSGQQVTLLEDNADFVF
jgi:hypothetical protein